MVLIRKQFILFSIALLAGWIVQAQELYRCTAPSVPPVEMTASINALQAGNDPSICLVTSLAHLVQGSVSATSQQAKPGFPVLGTLLPAYAVFLLSIQTRGRSSGTRNNPLYFIFPTHHFW